MASEQILSTRVPQEFFDRYALFVAEYFGDVRGARSVALLDAMNAQMHGGVSAVNQDHADQGMLIKALESELETLRNRPERIPTAKKKRPFVPLSAHHKARLQVLRCLGLSLQDGKTSSELAHQTNQNTNNVAKRLQELHHEGYVAPTGEYRLSLDSGKRLALWRYTGKPLPKGVRQC